MARAARLSSFLAALTAAAACATALAAPAAASWETPTTTLSPYRLGTGDVNATLDRDANALALWTSYDEVETPDRQNVYASTHPLGGAWSPLTMVWPGAYAVQSTLATNSSSDSVAAWVGGPDGYENTVHVAERSGSTGAWGGSHSFAVPDVTQVQPEVAINDRGDAIAIWVATDEGGSRIWASSRTADGWSEPVPISLADHQVQSSYYLSPRLALAADGTADVVWASLYSLGERSAEDIQHSHFDGTQWSEPDRLVTDAIAGVQSLELSDDGQGRLTAAWLLWTDTVVVQAAWRANGAWTIADVPANRQPSCVMPLAVSAGPNGRATVAWTEGSAEALTTISGVPGAWEQPRTVYTPPEGTTVDAITLRERFGKAPVAAWTTANYEDWTFGVLGSQLTAAGWQAPTLLSVTGGRNHSRPSVDVAPSGRAIGAWVAYSGYAGKVQVAWASGETPVPTPQPGPGGRGVLNPPFVRVRGGMLRLPRKGRTIVARLVNREKVVLRGTARLVHFYGRRAKNGSPMRTIAVQRRVRVGLKNPSKLRLKLNAEAIKRLRKSARHAYPARLYLNMRAPDGRTVRTTQTFTLDGWNRFGKGKRPRPIARKSC